MPSTDVLQQFGLSRNPFTDRTAEKTFLDGTSLYVHSDLQGFQPSGKATVGLLGASAGHHYCACVSSAVAPQTSMVSEDSFHNHVARRCRDDLHLLWQAGLWEDHHQDAGVFVPSVAWYREDL